MAFFRGGGLSIENFIHQEAPFGYIIGEQLFDDAQVVADGSPGMEVGLLQGRGLVDAELLQAIEYRNAESHEGHRHILLVDREPEALFVPAFSDQELADSCVNKPYLLDRLYAPAPDG